METITIAIIAFFAGGIVGGIISCFITVRLSRKVNDPRRTSKKSLAEMTKRIVWLCLINGCVWVWCSYVLAYLDKPQIAESLSQVAVTEIIGVVLVYCAKSAVENLSKNNNWPDKSVVEKSEAAPPDDSPGAG